MMEEEVEEVERPLASDSSLAVGLDENLTGVERLRDDLRKIRQRWNDRLLAEERPFWESYFNGDFEIVLHGDGKMIGADHINWVVRIPASSAIRDGIGPNPGVKIVDLSDGDAGQEVVMFVVVAVAGDGPKVKIRVPARLYLISNEVCGVGEGPLYRGEGFRGFKVLPFRRERKVKLLSGANAGNGIVHPVVEGFSEVIDHITHNRAKMLINWLIGAVGQAKMIRLSQQNNASRGPVGDLVQIVGQSGASRNQLINVAIGPFDL